MYLAACSLIISLLWTCFHRRHEDQCGASLICLHVRCARMIWNREMFRCVTLTLSESFTLFMLRREREVLHEHPVELSDDWGSMHRAMNHLHNHRVYTVWRRQRRTFYLSNRISKMAEDTKERIRKMFDYQNNRKIVHWKQHLLLVVDRMVAYNDQLVCLIRAYRLTLE